MKYILILNLLLMINAASAVVTHTFSAGNLISSTKINDNFNNSNKADWDSGWIAENSNSNHNTILTHNLGVIPSRIQMWIADRAVNPTIIRPNKISSPGLTYSSPENTSVTSTKVLLSFYGGDLFIFCSSGVNQCLREDGTIFTTSLKSGVIRVLLWK